MDMMPQVICAIITGRCADPDFAETSICTIISEPLTASLIIPNNLKVPTHPEPSPSPK